MRLVSQAVGIASLKTLRENYFYPVQGIQWYWRVACWWLLVELREEKSSLSHGKNNTHTLKSNPKQNKRKTQEGSYRNGRY